MNKFFYRGDTEKLVDKSAGDLKEFSQSGEYLPDYCFSSDGELLSEKEILRAERNMQIKTDC
ncbi:hypothetical protein KS573_003000 [Salmonella enterica]|nr:hypothetical protein [Salmonella enterica]EHF5150720.1 hypothetical protein [Salmonella enterica]EHQ9813760.1 hypothetical protein [Salmonella enterica]EIX6564010.1 hypothetical protein [Salmonella enterica]